MKILLFPALLLLCLAFGTHTFGATFAVNTYVDTLDAFPGDGVCLDDNGECSLRAAIQESNTTTDPDTVDLPEGIYTIGLHGPVENSNFSGDFDILHSITITGAGRDTTFVQGAYSGGIAPDRVFEIVYQSAVVTIEGMTIRYGRVAGTNGGGIRNYGTLTLNSSDVIDNVASSGGGGGIYNEGKLTVFDANINSNECYTNSGGTCYGGGVYNRPRAGLSMTMTQTNVLYNEANFTSSAAPNVLGFGGGIATNGMGGNTTQLDQTSISVNRAGGPGSMGAGIYIRSENGMAALNFSSSYAAQNFFSQGDGTYGGGVALHTAGGGSLLSHMYGINFIANDDPSPSFSWPYSGAIGGALAIKASGGMITANIQKSSMFYNRARRGGGIAITNAGGTGSTSGVNFTATNITVGLNTVNGPASSTTGAFGAGVYLERPVSGPPNITVAATFDFCTLMENSGTNPAFTNNGGGIYHSGSSMLTANLKNTIVSNNKWNAANNDLRGNFVSQNYNHFGTPVPAIFSGTTTNNSFGTVTYNYLDQSGATWFYVPIFGGGPLFNAIPNGTNGCGTTVTWDQRNIARPQWGACDKGAVEQ